MRRIVTAGLALAFATGARAEAPRTVSDYYLAMEATAGRLDGQVAERQKAGDMASAQRLVLTAAMVRRAAAEFRGAEQEFLGDPVSGLPAPVAERAEAALATAMRAEARAASEPPFVEAAQASFNALLAAVPQKTPHPVFYGLLSGDLAPLKADVVIYGFRLIDPLSKSIPVVSYGKTELGPSQVSVADERIEVTLPASVKSEVRFAPPPCEPRASFGLRVRATYWEKHGFWPIRWTSEVQTGADLYALPSPVAYSAAISASAETMAATTETVSFHEKSSLAFADCGESSAMRLSANLPPGAREATCSAAWVDVSGAARLSAQCRVAGETAEAAGEIAGAAKVCSPENLCTCLGKAQGFLEASGSYRIDRPAHQIKAAPEQAPLSFPAGGLGSGRIALQPGERLRHVAVAITRRACPTLLDSLDLALTDGGEASAVSKSGAFRAYYQDGELTVGAAEALARGP